MEAITSEEMESVSGGSWVGDLGRKIGNVIGAAMTTQSAVDAQENFMLSAMQYGV
ncbi:hypothetical protein ACLB1G_11105 [Oxalobacteraceae bacterium A2-2]